MGLDITLTAKQREAGNNNHAGRLRAQGFLPAVYYGHDLPEAQSLTLNYAEFKTAFLSDVGNRSLYTLLIEGQAPQPVLLKDYQMDPVSRKMLHVDLMKIDSNTPITVKVPLALVGKAVGVEKGGQLQHGEREIAVSGLPENIPSQIEADVSFLALGQTMHLSQVTLPEGLTMVKTVDLPVAAVVVPKGLKSDAEEAAAATAVVAAPEPEKKK